MYSIVRPSPVLSAAAACGIVAASPAMSSSRFLNVPASVNARAPYWPMSATAIICTTVLGSSALTILSPFRNHGLARFSMKKTGRMMA